MTGLLLRNCIPDQEFFKNWFANFIIQIYFEFICHASHGQSSKELFGCSELFGFGFKIKNSKAWSQCAMCKVGHKSDREERALLQQNYLVLVSK